jgi:DNA polymerase sigma
VGGDKLDNAGSSPKKALTDEEETKLTRGIEDLYAMILPSEESEDRRARFIKKLEKILNDEWPGNNIQVHVFGSSGNLLCTSDSDGE